MARGDSGRIVVEVDQDLKAALYATLAQESLTLKAWFIREAEHYVQSYRQPALFAAEPPTPEFATGDDDPPARS